MAKTKKTRSRDSTNTVKNTDAARERRLSGLRPWQPGQSGNPSGRPKRKPWLEVLDAYIARNPRRVAEVIDHLFQVATGKARGECVSAAKLLIERAEGPLAQRVEVSRKITSLRDLDDDELRAIGIEAGLPPDALTDLVQ